jgi:NADPH-dependent 2,4-dienoyl-CoA reductase/sulfur reductase-like enzyme
MAKFDYVIIGAGMTGEAAVRGIRGVDPTGTIALIGAERHAPYDRPPLSKALWKGEPEGGVWRPELPNGVSLRLGRKVTKLDRAEHSLTDDKGRTYRYRKLLLATGGAPRTIARDGDRIVHFRTLDDYRRVRALLTQPSHVIVIGGGFIGSEMAAALTMNGHHVTMLVPEDGIGTRIFPASLSRALNEYFGEKGVEVATGEGAKKVSADASSVTVKTTKGRTLAGRLAIVGIGIVPSDGLAKAARLKVGNGVLVNVHLRTSDPDIYAAGDVARFPSFALGRAVRLEHEDAARTMGWAAGRNMAGADEPYAHVPLFYSDLFELGYEAVGDVNPKLEIVEDWKEFARQGVVYYLSAGRVRGVLLWNVWGQADAARALISRPERVEREALKGRIGQ